MHIRSAKVNDAPALARVHVDSWCAAYGELVPESYLRGFSYQWRYEAMGFGPDGESKDIDWGTPLKAVRYAKALRSVDAT